MSRSGVTGLLKETSGVILEKRSFLKDSAADLLRQHICAGRIAPGTRLVEQELSTALGISRMPVRDALMRLEDEGLVTNRSSGRFVAELSAHDIRQIFEVRTPLEQIAAELATRNIDEVGRQTLRHCVQRMASAMRIRDRETFVRADVDIHRLLWTYSGNRYLIRALENMLGSLLLFISNSAAQLDWQETLELHEHIAEQVIDGNTAGARASLQRHMESIFEHYGWT